MSGKPYAGQTNVSAEKSQQEVMAVLRKFGADKMGTMEDRKANSAYLYFKFKNLDIQIAVPLPVFENYSTTDTGRQRTESSQMEAWQQAVRSRWRECVLMVKAKLVGVESGFRTIEQEFLNDIVVPGTAQNIGDILVPRLLEAAKTGNWSQLQLTNGR